jgi:uncharacterized membrane protein
MTMQRFGQWALAMGMIGFGILTVSTGDFVAPWEAVPAWVPARTLLAYVCAGVMIVTGVGLLISRTAPAAARLLLGYLVLWLLLLKTPALFLAPQAEVNWLGWGEIAIMVAGAMAVDARYNGGPGRRIARYLFGIALPPIGLSHFVYMKESSGMVPGWLPYHSAWVGLTGASHIAAGLGVLFGVYARLAAILEASMITIFTLLVWVPGLPHTWAPVLVSLAIGNGAWAVAGDADLSDRSRPEPERVRVVPPRRDDQKSPAAPV